MRLFLKLPHFPFDYTLSGLFPASKYLRREQNLSTTAAQHTSTLLMVEALHTNWGIGNAFFRISTCDGSSQESEHRRFFSNELYSQFTTGGVYADDDLIGKSIVENEIHLASQHLIAQSNVQTFHLNMKATMMKVATMMTVVCNNQKRPWSWMNL